MEIISIIFGTLLGDSHLEKRNPGNGSRFIFKLCNNNVEYLMWFHKFFYLRGYCNSTKPKLKHLIKKKNKVFFHYSFHTYTFGSFNWIHDIFYKWDSKQFIKIIPHDFSSYFSPLSLAIWFMNDGYIRGNSVRIAINGWNLDEIKEICNMLSGKYHIMTTIQKGAKNTGYNIYIEKNSIETLTKLIKPYMIESLTYKLGPARYTCGAPATKVAGGKNH